MSPRVLEVAFDARMVTWAGVGTYSLSLLRELGRNQDEFRLRLLALRRAADTFLEDLPELAGVAWLIVDSDPWSPRGSLAAGLAARGRADLYHAPHVTIPTGFGGPLVTTIHDLIPLLQPETMPSRLKRGIFRTVVDWAVRRSEVVLTVSRHTGEELYRLAGRPRSLGFAPGAVDAALRPAPPAEIERVRAAYGLPEGYLLWVGAFRPHKNVEALIRAYASLGDRLRARHGLVLAGKAEGPQAESTRALAERLLRDPGVTLFPGFVPPGDLPGLYSGAALFVFPSFAEGFGLPPLEAMACGCPVVSSERTALPEVLGPAAWYFDPARPEELAERLRLLLENPDLRSRASAAGLSWSRRFTWRRTAEETVRAYRAAVSRRTAASSQRPGWRCLRA